MPSNTDSETAPSIRTLAVEEMRRIGRYFVGYIEYQGGIFYFLRLLRAVIILITPIICYLVIRGA